MAKTTVKQYFSLSDHAKRLMKYLESPELSAAREGYEKRDKDRTQKVKELSTAFRKPNTKRSKVNEQLVSKSDYNKAGKQLERKLHTNALYDLISYDTYVDGRKSELRKAVNKHYTDAQVKQLLNKLDIPTSISNYELASNFARSVGLRVSSKEEILRGRLKSVLAAKAIQYTMFNFFVAADIDTHSIYTLPSHLDAWKKLSEQRYYNLKYDVKKIADILGIKTTYYTDDYLLENAIKKAYEQAQSFIDDAYTSYEKAYKQHAIRNAENVIARLKKKQEARKKALYKNIKNFKSGKTPQEELSNEYILEKKYKNMLLELDYARKQEEAVNALRGLSIPSIDTTLRIQPKKISTPFNFEQAVIEHAEEIAKLRFKHMTMPEHHTSEAQRREYIDEANRTEQERVYLSPNIQAIREDRIEDNVLDIVVDELFDINEQTILKGKDILRITVDKIMDLLIALTPVDTGNLLQSVTVSYTDNNNTATISFDMHAAPYAVRQHEDTTLTHTNGGAKFLQNAVIGAFTSIPDAQKYLAAHLTIRGYTEALQQMVAGLGSNAVYGGQEVVKQRIKEHKTTEATESLRNQLTAATPVSNASALSKYLNTYGPQLSVTLFNRAYYGIKATSQYNVNNIVRDSGHVQIVDNTIDEILKNNNILNKAFNMVIDEIDKNNLHNDKLLDTRLIASLIRNRHFKYKSVENADIAKLYSLISTASKNNDRLQYNGFIASLLVKHGINVTAVVRKSGRKET